MRTSDLTITYAQNREDIILSAFFTDVSEGFYVDVGAYDPVEDSVTKYFYEKGWHGINVEPNKIFYRKLKRDRQRDINLNVGVSNKQGTLVYREYLQGKGLSTFSDVVKNEYETTETDRPIKKYKDFNIKVKTLRNIFEEHKVEHIHFLKVDVEGYEFEVLESNDWKLYRPEVICIEANHVKKDWRALLTKADYMLVFNDGLNEYYLDKAKKERWDNFKYVEMAIGRDIVTPEQYELGSTLAKSRQSIEALIQKNTKLKERISVLETSLADSKRLRNQIKGLVRAVDNVISVRIDNLGKLKYKHVNFSYNNDDDASQLVQLAHEVDRTTYSRKRPGSKRIAHKTIDTTYRVGKKAVKKTAKATLRLLKSGKRALRGAKS